MTEVNQQRTGVSWRVRIPLLFRLTVGLVGIPVGVPAVGAQQPPVSNGSFDAAMATAIREEGLVGGAWALVWPDTTIVGAAGLRDASRGTTMRAHDRVQVGSVAKTLLALGALQLVTEGRLELDAPLSRYLPDLPIRSAADDDPPLLVRHLLDHTGGLDDARMWQVFTLRADPNTPLRDGLALDRGGLRLRHRPGERFSYSNSGFLLLGMVIEAVVGTRYETYLDRVLLAPLGMSKSTFAFVTQTGPFGDSTLVMGHFDPVTTSATVPNFVRPASQFTTTAEDMARLARFLMSDGVVGGRPLVRGDLLRAMAIPSTTEAARAGLAAGYGLGLVRRDRYGAVGNCHLGNIGTFRAILCLYPEQGRGFFMALNTDPENGNFDRVDGMLARALDLEPPAERSRAAPAIAPAEWNGTYVVRPNRFAQFAYLDELTGITWARWRGDSLTLRPLQGKGRTLIPVGGAFFRATDRRETSHVLLRHADGRTLIADGQRTFEWVPGSRIFALWASAAGGIASLLYVLGLGGTRTLGAFRRGEWRSEPLVAPTLCLLLLILAPVLYLTQSFLAIGDPTPANVTVAVLTATLPLTLVLAAVRRVRAGVATRAARADLVALMAALQWCAVLGAWGLIPLALWR